jgi:hypothetical protein
MRQRLAKNSALADIGRAENQPVDIRVQGAAVEELEAEIDRLHHRLENQARTIKVQEATIARQGEDAENLSKLLECAANEEERKDWLLWWDAGFQQGKEGSVYMDKLNYWEKWAKLIFGDLLSSIHKYQDGAYCSSSTHANSALVYLHRIFCPSEKAPCKETALILEQAYQEMRILRAVPEAFNPLRDSTRPVEPPVPTEAANVPREAVGVHPSPNVTIAERLGK